MFGVVAAHQALQFRKFADHAGEQVRLGQLRRLAGVGDARAHARGDELRDEFQAPYTIELTAQLVMENDRGELRYAVCKPGFLVCFEEESCVRQSRPDHALVALDDVARIGQFHVADDEEAIGQLALAVEQREVLLVGAHGENQAFLRDGQEFGFELADIDGGEFNQRRDFIQQRRNRFRCAQRGPAFRRLQTELPFDLGLAFLKGGDHLAVCAQRLFPGIGGRNVDVLHALETVPVRDASGLDAEHGNWHDVAAMQGDQRVCRAHERHGRRAVFELIAHDLRDGQFGERLLEGQLQSLSQWHAGDGLRQVDVFGIAFRPALGLVGRGAFLLETLLQGGGGLSGGIEGHLRGHQFPGFGPARRFTGDGRHQHREPARRSEGARHDRSGNESACSQFLEQRTGKTGAECRECFRRQLFREQFDQQIRAHAASPARSAKAACNAGRSMPSRVRASCLHIGKPAWMRESR